MKEGEKYMGEKSVGEKSFGENRGRWDAGFRFPLLRFSCVFFCFLFPLSVPMCFL